MKEIINDMDVKQIFAYLPVAVDATLRIIITIIILVLTEMNPILLKIFTPLESRGNYIESLFPKLCILYAIIKSQGLHMELTRSHTVPDRQTIGLIKHDCFCTRYGQPNAIIKAQKVFKNFLEMLTEIKLIKNLNIFLKK